MIINCALHFLTQVRPVIWPHPGDRVRPVVDHSAAATAARRPIVAWVSTKAEKAQSAIPAAIGTAVPSKKTLDMTMATAAMTKCSVPISDEAVPAISLILEGEHRARRND